MRRSTHIQPRARFAPRTQTWVVQWRRWTTGSRGREAAVTPSSSRYSVVWRNQKTDMGTPEPRSKEAPTRSGVWKVRRGSGLGPERATGNPAIDGAKAKSRSSHVKHEKVMEQVYEPGRLWAAWQQVRRNAGAAGIDRTWRSSGNGTSSSCMTSRRRLSDTRPVADRGAAYLAGTSRSVGRGWPPGHLLPDRGDFERRV